MLYTAWIKEAVNLFLCHKHVCCYCMRCKIIISKCDHLGMQISSSLKSTSLVPTCYDNSLFCDANYVLMSIKVITFTFNGTWDRENIWSIMEVIKFEFSLTFPYKCKCFLLFWIIDTQKIIKFTQFNFLWCRLSIKNEAMPIKVIK